MSNDEGCHGAQWDELGGSPSLGLAHSSSTTDRLALSPPGSRPETSPRGSSDSNPTQKTATATFQDGRALVSERHPVVPAPPLTTPRSPSLAPLPPPPVPLPSSYSHPSLPPTPRRRPLPAPPSTSPRFVPLHPPPLPPPVPSTRRATGGPHDTIPQPLTAAEEKAAARARAQGLDELFAARSDADRAVVKAAADDRDEAADAAASPTSPAGTDLPEYPASPARRGPSGAAGKRALLRDGGADDPRQEEEGDAKRAQAEAEVRERVLSDARRTVEEDAAACKVALRRRAAEADEEERERERRRWECEGEKRLEGLRLDADEGGEEELEEDEEEAPPPLSPATLARGRDMFPLVGEDSKALPPSLTDVDERENEPPAAPPSSQPNRLPPPPVPLPEPAYPLSPATPSTRESVALPPPVDDYFFRPHPSRPSFDAHAFSEPLPPLRAQAPWPRRVPTARSATLAPSTSARSHLYAGAVATGEQGYPSSSSHSHGSVRPPAGTRHGSLGPAHSFYSSGVGQVNRPVALAARGSTSDAASPARQDWFAPDERTAGPPRVAPARQQPYVARSGAAGTGGSDSGTRHEPPRPVAATASSWHSSASTAPYPSHTSGTALPAAQRPLPAAVTPTPAPAFYTSLTPGGPLLPFYATTSDSSSPPSAQPTSYFSPAAAHALGVLLPPPGAPPVFASLGHAHNAQGQQGYPSPFPLAPAAAFQAPHGAASPTPSSMATGQTTSPRPWSRGSSAGSPPVAAGAGEQRPAARERRVSSTIRSLFGRRKGDEAGRGLAGMREEGKGEGDGSSWG